jgi:hemerythrin-like metal-binding protein
MKRELLEWTPSYELGIEDIDFQHHFFFNLIVRLAKDLTESDDVQYRSALISELNAYARFHFISEENLMMRHGFPELGGHKYLHMELLDQLSTRANMLALEANDKQAQEIVDFLVDWFLQHTSRIDRIFAEYLHARNSSA